MLKETNSVAYTLCMFEKLSTKLVLRETQWDDFYIETELYLWNFVLKLTISCIKSWI